MSVHDAKLHLDEAIQQLGIKVETISLAGELLGDRQDCLSIELDRIDRALGGGTMLQTLSQCVRAAFVEILAARDALNKGSQAT